VTSRAADVKEARAVYLCVACVLDQRGAAVVNRVAQPLLREPAGCAVGEADGTQLGERLLLCLAARGLQRLAVQTGGQRVLRTSEGGVAQRAQALALSKLLCDRRRLLASVLEAVFSQRVLLCSLAGCGVAGARACVAQREAFQSRVKRRFGGRLRRWRRRGLVELL
jgi:hypothetical protein